MIYSYIFLILYYLTYIFTGLHSNQSIWSQFPIVLALLSNTYLYVPALWFVKEAEYVFPTLYKSIFLLLKEVTPPNLDFYKVTLQ